MSQDYTYSVTLSSNSSCFFDLSRNLEYWCRLGLNAPPKVEVINEYEDGHQLLQTKLNDVIKSDKAKCSQRGSLFDVSLKFLPTTSSSSRQKVVGSVYGIFFKNLVKELLLQSPLLLELTIEFKAPLNKTVTTKETGFISGSRDKVWPKAFTFEMELEDAPWTFPKKGTAVNYSLEAEISACPFKESTTGLGITPRSEDGETALMNKKFLEDRVGCDFTLVSGDGKERLRCHQMFLAASSQFFERLTKTNMKEGQEKECRLEESSKEGINAMLKFLYYRGVEDPLKSSAVAYELLDLGEKYNIPRLEEAMQGLLLAKLDEWWDLEVALKLFLRARPLEDRNDEWRKLNKKAKEVLKARSGELASETSTLLEDLWRKYPKAAKELWLASASQ